MLFTNKQPAGYLQKKMNRLKYGCHRLKRLVAKPG